MRNSNRFEDGATTSARSQRALNVGTFTRIQMQLKGAKSTAPSVKVSSATLFAQIMPFALHAANARRRQSGRSSCCSKTENASPTIRIRRGRKSTWTNVIQQRRIGSGAKTAFWKLLARATRTVSRRKADCRTKSARRWFWTNATATALANNGVRFWK